MTVGKPNENATLDLQDESGITRISLPHAPSADLNSGAVPAVAAFTPLRVLVVDDLPDAADALAAVLNVFGCIVRACHDGPTALTIAAEFRPQVCMLDLCMPEMDGLELAARLREQAGGRPLVFVAVTSLDDIEALTWTALGGFHAHLIKTVDVPTLVATLTRVGRVFARLSAPPTDGLPR